MSYWLALKALPWRLIGLASLAFFVLALFAHDRLMVAQNGKLKAQIEKCAEARKADRNSYEAAQREAAAKNAADVSRKEQAQQEINHEQVSNLNARIELLRRELRKGTPAPQGSAGGPAAPQADNRPAAPGEAGVCYSPEVVLRAAENEERHDQLITTVEKLMKLLNAPTL